MLKTIQKRNLKYLLQGKKSDQAVVSIFVIFMTAKGSVMAKEKDNHGSMNSKTQTKVY